MDYEDFCSTCGAELIRVPKPAHKLWIYYYPDNDMPLGEKYNPKTGMRQFGVQVRCPNKRWWNNHTCYTDEKSLHDSDLPELLKM